MRRNIRIVCAGFASLLFWLGGCASTQSPRIPGPDVAPKEQPGVALLLGHTRMAPMFRRFLAINLLTVIKVARARNIDIQRARQRVHASEGRYEASVEAVFPVIAPMFAYRHIYGVDQNADGTIDFANFNDFIPALSVDWIINPGQVAYNIIASEKRLEAAGKQASNIVLATLKSAALEYYDLVLAQARVAAAREAVVEARELLRIAKANLDSGMGLPADVLAAESNLAAQQRNLLFAVNNFYQRSIALCDSLDLDPTVTLVPKTRTIRLRTLVRRSLGVKRLLAIAMEFRPDLKAAGYMLQAAGARKGSVIWGGLGPDLQANYTLGGLATDASGTSHQLQQAQNVSLGGGFQFGPSIFGRTKTATADQRLAELTVKRRLEKIRAEVVSAVQSVKTFAAVIPLAHEALVSAREAFRLAQANLRIGTMVELNVLQAQNVLDDARMRYVDAVIHYNQSQINLLAAIGLLNSARLISTPSMAGRSAAHGLSP